MFRSLWGCSHWCWKQIRYLCYSTWLWKWTQWINGVILDKSVSWLLVLSTVNVRWFTLCVEQGQDNATRLNNCFPSDEPSFALQPLDQKRSSDTGSICTAAITSVLGLKVAEILGPYKSPPRSRNYSALALYFLRCISSKTVWCKPGQTEVFCSNYCFKRVSCSPAVFWLMQELILSQWFVSVGLTASVRANSAPRLLWWRLLPRQDPFLQSSAVLFHEINFKCFNVSWKSCCFKMQSADAVGKFSFSLAWASEDFELGLQTVSAW